MLALACFCGIAQAEKTEKQEKPSMAFLEFLADLEKVNGEYVSPMLLSEDQKSEGVPVKADTPVSGKEKPVIKSENKEKAKYKKSDGKEVQQ